MKNILTIAATGVICVLAAATQTLAQQNNAGADGSASARCAITGTTTGRLVQNNNGDLTTDFAGGSQGTVGVVCSRANATLVLDAPVLTPPAGAKPATATSNFSGGTGPASFTGAVGQTIPSIITKKAGATANVSSLVVANDGEILTPGSYTVVVPARITP
jgi:hypothetical protein